MLIPTNYGDTHPAILSELTTLYRMRHGAKWGWPPRHLYGTEYAWIIEQAKEKLGSFEKKSLVDAGGGASALSAYLALRGAKVRVVDRKPEPSTGRLPDGRVIPEIGVVTADLAKPLPWKRLDGIVSCSAIEHNSWPTIVAIVRNLLARLKPGAPLIITVPAGRKRVYYPAGKWPAPYAHFPECYLWDHEALHELEDAVSDRGTLRVLRLATDTYVKEWDRMQAEMKRFPEAARPYLSMGILFERVS